MNLAYRDIRHNAGRFVLTCVGLGLLTVEATDVIRVVERLTPQIGQMKALVSGRLRNLRFDEQSLVDAQLVEEATTPEARHGWVIEVEPEADASEPTAEQVAQADATVRTLDELPAVLEELERR